ncbi:MAG TPA: condensation domain-containing protein, partial [Thermoanaerobaculia bacterium]
RPIGDTRVHLLDRRLQPVPVGVPGELFLAGAGLARGYLGRPDLTAERFVPDPFAEAPGERLYRTGDLARYRPAAAPDGEIEYLGRLDHQVKVRGFRIELGELEAALVRLPGIAEAAALVRDDLPGGRGLVAYVAGSSVDGAEIRRALAGHLPAHMVPSLVVALKALPRTATGKVDRRALAAAPQVVEGWEERPWTAMEERVAALYASLLDVRGGKVSRDDSFFELGGHSLLALRLVSRIAQDLGVALPLSDLFEAPTVAGLAARLAAAPAAAEAAVALVPVPRDRPLPLSLAQERLWVLEQLDPGTPLYSIAAAVELAGALRPEALAAALSAVVRRHEALRTTFQVVDGEAVQAIAPPEPSGLPLPTVDLTALPSPAREDEGLRVLRAEAARPFDLATGPVVRTLLLHLAADRSWLLLTVHHLVADGWSMGLLLREVAVLYRAALAGTAAALPALAVQYADHAVWQRQRLSGAALADEIAFWRWRLEGLPPALDLPTDRPRPASGGTRGAVREFALAADTSRQVADLARRHGVTPFMAVLAALDLLLARLSGQRDLTVGLAVAGRGRVEVEPLIGLFVNTLVLRTEVEPAATAAELLRQVRRTVVEAQEHQDLPFARLVAELRLDRDMAGTPLFQVLAAPSALGGAELDLPGVLSRLLPVDTGTAKFDLTLFLGDGPELAGAFEYRSDLWDGATIDRWVGHLGQLLGGFAARPGEPVGGLPLLSTAERAQLTGAWSADAANRATAQAALLAGDGPVPSGVVVRAVFVLDEQAEPAPIGVPGEIHVAGEGVDSAACGDAARDALRLVPHPYAQAPGERLLVTGELGRYKLDGRLERLGRRAQQARVRGARVRLDEVEAVLASHPGVSEAAVVARGDGLAAFVVVKPDGPGILNWRTYTLEQLPPYKVPAELTVLEALPRSAGGGIDRRALLAIESRRPLSAPAPRAAATPVEQGLVEIWREVLGVESVGVDASFFDLGGHSLLALRMGARIRDRFGVTLALRQMFGAFTIAALAERVEEALLQQADAARLDALLNLLEGMDEGDVAAVEPVATGKETG